MVRPPPRRPRSRSASPRASPQPVAIAVGGDRGVALGIAGRPRREDLAVADALREQLLVRADGLHPPAIEEHHPLGQGDRGRAVGDDDGAALGHHGGQRVADLVLLRRVDGGRGVVEHEHAGVGQDRPGDGDALALAAREGEPALAEQRVVAVREVVHELGRTGQRGGPLDALERGVGVGERDVGGDGVVEEQGVLEDDPDRAAQVVDAEPPEVDPVELDGAGVHVVEAGEQAGHGRLAGPGRAHEGDRGARLDGEVEAVEDRVGVVVAEADVGEADAARALGGGAGRQRLRMGRVGDDGLGREHLVDPFEGGGGALRPGHRHADRPQRPHQQRHVGVERHEAADAERSLRDQVAADAQHQDEPDRRHEVDRGQVVPADPRGPQRGGPDVLGLPGELGQLHGLRPEALHHAHARHGLLDHGRHLGRLGLHGQHGGVDVGGEPLGQDVDDRQRDERAEGEQRVHGQQHRGHADDQGQVRHRQRDHHDEGLHLLEVVAGPAHELPGLRPVVEADVERLQVREEPLPQPTLGQARLPEGEVATRGAQGPGHEPDHDDGQRPREQRAVAVDGLVDGGADEEGDGDLGPAPEQADQPAEGDAPLLGRQRGAEQAPALTTATRGHQAPLLPFVAAGRRPDVPTPRRGYRRGSATTQRRSADEAGPVVRCCA